MSFVEETLNCGLIKQLPRLKPVS